MGSSAPSQYAHPFGGKPKEINLTSPMNGSDIVAPFRPRGPAAVRVAQVFGSAQARPPGKPGLLPTVAVASATVCRRDGIAPSEDSAWWAVAWHVREHV